MKGRFAQAQPAPPAEQEWILYEADLRVVNLLEAMYTAPAPAPCSGEPASR